MIANRILATTLIQTAIRLLASEDQERPSRENRLSLHALDLAKKHNIEDRRIKGDLEDE